MTPTPEQTMSAEEAALRIALFAETHPIDPRPAPDGRTVCGHDGLGIYTVKNGWRHDLDEVARVRMTSLPVAAATVERLMATVR